MQDNSEDTKQAWNDALEAVDEMLNEVGLKLYCFGDKAGWNLCDELGHVVRDMKH